MVSVNRAHPADSIVLVFDGNCGVCTRLAQWVQRIDHHGRVRIEPSQGPGVRERFGLTEADARSAAWAFSLPIDGHREGFRWRGAEAVARALDAICETRLWVPLVRIWGIRQAAAWCYSWVARHRSRFPGVAPWCEQFPGSCER